LLISFFVNLNLVLNQILYPMPSIFIKIISREIPAYIIAEDEKFISFLDISPLTKGHALVVPKKEIDYIFDIEDELLSDMILFAKKVARAINKSVDCERVGVMVVGIEVRHAHIHLIPFKTADELSFQRPKLKLEKEELLQISKKIISNL